MPNHRYRGLRCTLWLAWGGCLWPPCVLGALCEFDRVLAGLVRRRVKPIVSAINMDPKMATEKFGQSDYTETDADVLSQIHAGKTNDTPPTVGCSRERSAGGVALVWRCAGFVRTRPPPNHLSIRVSDDAFLASSANGSPASSLVRCLGAERTHRPNKDDASQHSQGALSLARPALPLGSRGLGFLKASRGVGVCLPIARRISVGEAPHPRRHPCA